MNTYCTVIVLCLIPLTGATQSEIVGGKIAKPHSRPYMASLQVNGHICGGFLIREDFVLTAAHCKKKPMIVVLGAQNIRKWEDNQQRIQVDKYFQHPNYINGKRQYDIMLLKLKQKAKLNKKVKPIALLKTDKNIQAKKKCWVAGWGKTEPTDDSPSSVLKEAEETILPNPECKNTWEKYFNESHMICTKFDKKNGEMCQGDSGGPFVCKKKPVGIVAFTGGDNCSDREYPHVYTKIFPFLSWIENVMKKQGNAA